MSDPQRFLDALRRTLPPDERRAVRSVLVIGPGKDDPIAALLAEFDQARLTAIDVDMESIAGLRERLQDSVERVELIRGDAAIADQLPEGPYDLVIIRHPDIARQMESWQSVLQLAVDRLRHAGTLIITAYSLPEIAFADQIIGGLEADVLPGSPYTATPVPLQGNDRYILMARKRVVSV